MIFLLKRKFPVNSRSILIDILIISSFIFLSIMNVLFIWNHGILNGNDLYFHLSRLEELVRSDQLFPRFAFNSFAGNGSAVMTMYPYLLLYPFAIIIKLVGHLKIVIYVLYIFIFITASIVAYFSSIKISKNRLTSYVFSLLYVFSYEFLAFAFWSCDIGMFLSAAFMPLVIFGYICWIKYDKWIMLSFGATLIIYSNVTVAFFVPFLFLLWCLLDYKIIDKKHVINILKSIILSLITTMFFWLPALDIFISNKFKSGNIKLNIGNVGEVKPTALLATLIPEYSFRFNGWFPWELTIYSLFGLAMGAIFFLHFDYIKKQMYLFSIIVLALSSSFFIWDLPIFSKFSGIIQTTIRMYLIPQVLLTYLFSCLITKFLYKKSYKFLLKWLFGIVLCACLIQGGYIYIFHFQQNIAYTHATGNFKYKNISICKSPQVDYYLSSPKVSNLIKKDKTYVKNKHTIHFIPMGQGKFKFYSRYKKIKNMPIPILKYNNINYRCQFDDKFIRASYDKDHLITIRNVRRGYHYIRVINKPSKISFISGILTVIGFTIYLIIVAKIVINRFKILIKL